MTLKLCSGETIFLTTDEPEEHPLPNLTSWKCNGISGLLRSADGEDDDDVNNDDVVELFLLCFLPVTPNSIRAIRCRLDVSKR